MVWLIIFPPSFCPSHPFDHCVRSFAANNAKLDSDCRVGVFFVANVGFAHDYTIVMAPSAGAFSGIKNIVVIATTIERGVIYFFFSALLCFLLFASFVSPLANFSIIGWVLRWFFSSSMFYSVNKCPLHAFIVGLSLVLSRVSYSCRVGVWWLVVTIAMSSWLCDQEESTSLWFISPGF